MDFIIILCRWCQCAYHMPMQEMHTVYMPFRLYTCIMSHRIPRGAVLQGSGVMQVTTIIAPAVLSVFVLNFQVSFLDAATALFGYYLSEQIQVRGTPLRDSNVRSLVSGQACPQAIQHVCMSSQIVLQGSLVSWKTAGKNGLSSGCNHQVMNVPCILTAASPNAA